MTDAAGLIGSIVNMPNGEWGISYDDGGTTPTRVLAYVEHGGEGGGDVYVCEAEGHNYIFLVEAVTAAATANA